MDKQPLFFSLVIPTFNRANFIAQTLESVLNQDYAHFEVLLVDDGSSDHTAEVVKPYLGKQVQYFKKDNGERAAARNYGIARAKGDYISFLDSDDRLLPHYFSEARRLIHEKNQPEFLHLAYEIHDTEGNQLAAFDQRKGDLNRQLVRGNHLSCIGVFVRREVLEKNKFNEDRALSGSEDYELWMRLASRYPLHYSNRISARMIQHDLRSVINIEANSLEKRIQLAVKYITADEIFIRKFENYQGELKAHLFLYLALHLILAKYKARGLKYAFSALLLHFPVLFSKKFLVILYKLMR